LTKLEIYRSVKNDFPVTTTNAFAASLKDGRSVETVDINQTTQVPFAGLNLFAQKSS
jgi:hypothetical protein